MRDAEYAPGEPFHGRPAVDLILVGGGLANGLIADRLLRARPQLRLLMLESAPRVAGNHTWSFHGTDLTPAQLDWLAPLVRMRWDGHEVHFPGLSRRLGGGYASISSDRFEAWLHTRLGDRIRTDQHVVEVAPRSVRLADGTLLRAGAVIDGRGPRDCPHLQLGYQKFLGLELRTERPHGLERPILMDATVPQQGGYRFVYVLPLASDLLLVEDTCYADGEALDPDVLRQRVLAYAHAQGWAVRAVEREEQGVLPILLGGDVRAFWADARGVPRAGLAAGLFHPTTGYSLPEAVRLAEHVATLPDLSAPALFHAVREHALARWRAQGFFRMLNRMFFRAAAGPERWRVMHRFYGLGEDLIAHFYAGRLTPLDKLRLVTGKPPVPLLRGVRAAFGWQGGDRHDAATADAARAARRTRAETPR